MNNVQYHKWQENNFLTYRCKQESPKACAFTTKDKRSTVHQWSEADVSVRYSALKVKIVLKLNILNTSDNSVTYK